MQHRWLALLSIAFLTIIVFVFTWHRNQPIEIPVAETTETLTVMTEPTITFVNPSYGAQTPEVTIVVFSDFTCSACKTLETSLKVAEKTYPDDVRIVWKDLPNESLHELATPSAIAAHCADQQGSFWPYHDLLFDRQTYLSESQFTMMAQELGLDTERFQECYDARDTLPIVKKDYNEGLALGLTSTPTMFINDEIMIGAVTTESILDIVEGLIQK